jgi:hypothetical protein
MTTENPSQYAQDESKKRFQDSSWDRTTRDDSWKRFFDSSWAYCDGFSVVMTAPVRRRAPATGCGGCPPGEGQYAIGQDR